MRKGEKAVLTCPPEMAYGDRAISKIPAGSTLKFEVELIDFVDKPPEKKVSITTSFEGEGETIPAGS